MYEIIMVVSDTWLVVEEISCMHAQPHNVEH